MNFEMKTYSVLSAGFSQRNSYTSTQVTSQGRLTETAQVRANNVQNVMNRIAIISYLLDPVSKPGFY